MKRLSTFLLLTFLGFTVAKAQYASDLLYVAGQNDNTPGDAPTLYVSGGADLYVQGGVNIEGTNLRSTGDGLIQVAGTLHISANDSSGTPAPGNWSNNTTAPVYAYNNNPFSVPTVNTYAPGYSSITYGTNANDVSLEYGNDANGTPTNQLISGASSAATSYFYNLTLLDSTVNRTTVNSYKTIVNADIYVGAITGSAAGDTMGTLDLNDEYLNTQNNSVHILNPSTATSGIHTAISRIDDYSGSLGNSAPFNGVITGGMVIAGNVAVNQTAGRLIRVTDSTASYFFPVGTLVTQPSGLPSLSGQAYDLFRPAEITPTDNSNYSFGVALAARDGFVDAGTALDQQMTPYNSLAGINHQSYYKINQLSGSMINAANITFTHYFSNNSEANTYPNWSTCGALPTPDFPQTLTIAQWDNNPTGPVSWNDVCHNSGPTSLFSDYATTCGSVTATPDSGFCNSTVLQTPPALDQTSTSAYFIPGSFTNSPGSSTQEDYTVAGMFFTVDGGNGSCDGNCAALPINIISLTGWNVPNENANEVQWVTATEDNIDFFWVEKSVDGINFTNISGDNGVAALNNGHSNANQTYTFLDKQPNMGNNYYRIQEFNYMSQSIMTNVINVPLTKPITIANIYPNPTSDLLNIAFETANTGTVHVEIYDVLGRLVMSNDNAVAEGNNTITLNASTLTAGSYFIRLTDAASDFTDTQKFIKITE